MTARPRRTDRGLRASGCRAHAWALLVAVTLLAAGCGPRQGEFLTTIKQVRDLKPSDADRGYPVRLRGITTYSHASSRSLIVQVGADAILVVTPTAQTPPPPGREVEIEGITGTGESSAIVVAASVRDLLAAKLPVAEAISSKDLSSSRYAYRRVEIEGIVRSFLLDNAQRLTLGVATEDGMVRAQVNVAGPQVPVDSRVRIRGVAASMFDLRGGVIRQQILVPGLSDVMVVEAGAADPFSLPVQSVATLLQSPASAVPRHRVRIQGAFTHADGAPFLEDGTGSLVVFTDDLTVTRPKGRVDVAGFLTLRDGSLTLEDATVRPLAEEPASLAQVSKAPVIRTIADVRRLSPTEARNGYPVQVRAIVTSPSPAAPTNAFIQDSTGGIFLVSDPARQVIRPAARQLIEITGQTGSGAFAPNIVNATFRVIGEAPLPEPLRVPERELLTGYYDSRLVEIEGIVQTVVRVGTNTNIAVSVGTHLFNIDCVRSDRESSASDPPPRCEGQSPRCLRLALQRETTDARHPAHRAGFVQHHRAQTGTARAARTAGSACQHTAEIQQREGRGTSGTNAGRRHASNDGWLGLHDRRDRRTSHPDAPGQLGPAG